MSSPAPIAEVSTLQAPYWNGSQWVRDVASPEEILAGDTLLVMVGGGNKVDSYPGGDWQSLDYQTGQEAQGFVMAATFSSDEGFPSWTLAFDGSDKSMVSVVHLRVPGLRVSVDASTREGSVGVARPAEVVPLSGAGKDDTEYVLAFVRNSGGAYPTSGDAESVHSISNGNEGAALFRRQPTEDVTIDVSLPSCTGRYVVAVGLYVPTWGAWRDDSAEFWSSGPGFGSLTPSWDSSAADPSNTVYQQSYYDLNDTTAQEAADAAWSGSGTASVGAPTSSSDTLFTLQDTTPLGGPTRVSSRWLTLFGTVARASGSLPGFVSGTLPDSVYDPVAGDYVDPDVLDVEWESSPEPLDQRLNLHIDSQPIPSGPYVARARYTVYAISESLSATLGPTSFTTAAEIAAGTELHATSAASEVVTYAGPVLGSDPSAALRLRFAALDQTTKTGVAYTPPTDGTTTGAHAALTVELQQLYRPRFRLLYRHGVVVTTSVTRLWPRDDALGLGTANRLVPPPRANRIVGNQP